MKSGKSSVQYQIIGASGILDIFLLRGIGIIFHRRSIYYLRKSAHSYGKGIASEQKYML